jgi:nicotinamidase/pyrazinamidase
MSYEIADSDVLVVVDVQNDFCPGGSLPVPHGDEVVPIINKLGERFPHVLLTQDWHPPDHRSFASAHPGRQPFQSIELSYGPQMLWPDHCVQGSTGAQFHAGLQIPRVELILRKGYRRDIGSGLAGYLRERGFSRVFLAGLAFDFCVRFSAEDARRVGFEAVVMEDACRGMDTGGSVAASRQALQRLDVACSLTEAIR